MTRILALVILFGVIYLPVCAADQHASISQIEAHLSTAITGAAEYDFSGTINFERSMDDYIKLGDSTAKTYVLVIKFKEGNKPVKVNPGLEKRYGDEDDLFVLRQVQKLSMTDLYKYNFSFSVPVAAFNLPEGKHNLTPVVSLMDEETLHSILRKEKEEPVLVTILPTSKIRLWVKYILADSVDAQGNLWDYFVLRPAEGNPDIYWSLDYAGQSYFTSKVAKNVFEYFDNDKRETYDLTISKGDSFVITVKDKDDLTTDDLIGAIVVATADPKHENGALIAAKAGQIKKLEYEILFLPQP